MRQRLWLNAMRGAAVGAGVGGGWWGWQALRRYALRRIAQPRRVCDPQTPADYGLAYNEIWFESRDGLHLHGWHIPTPRAKATILLGHGYSGNKPPDLVYARFLHAGGYSVFMFDCRAHGRSEGDFSSIGYVERLDMLGALDWLRANTDECRFGAMGFSMGAATALHAAADSLDIRGIVADSPPAYVPDSIVSQLRRDGVPRPIARVLAAVGYRFVAGHMGFRFSRQRTASVLARISPRPILLFYGEKDDLTDVANHATAWTTPHYAGRRALVIVPRAGHVGAYPALGREYERRVLAFFDGLDWADTPVLDHGEMAVR